MRLTSRLVESETSARPQPSQLEILLSLTLSPLSRQITPAANSVTRCRLQMCWTPGLCIFLLGATPQNRNRRFLTTVSGILQDLPVCTTTCLRGSQTAHSSLSSRRVSMAESWRWGPLAAIKGKSATYLDPLVMTVIFTMTLVSMVEDMKWVMRVKTSARVTKRMSSTVDTNAT
jgi:hypothetical protein